LIKITLQLGEARTSHGTELNAFVESAEGLVEAVRKIVKSDDNG
jgi:hypothetical protein